MRKGFTLIELMIVIAIIAIIAAIAIPNLLESRITANEAASGATLKSGVFPAQVQFQAGGYQDSDLDNVGEYGIIGALVGVDATSKGGAVGVPAGQLNLLTGPLKVGAALSPLRFSSGYSYTSYAPNSNAASGGATTTFWQDGTAAPAATAVGADANNGERFFFAACSPTDYNNSGRRPFLISQDGQVRSPAIQLSVNRYFNNIAPVVGFTPTAAQIRDGAADCFTPGVAFVITCMDANGNNPTHPVYSK